MTPGHIADAIEALRLGPAKGGRILTPNAKTGVQAPEPSPTTCPECGSSRRNVMESRRMTDRVRRRCNCADCDARWTTYEITDAHLRKLENPANHATAVAIQTARLIRILDFFRDRLIASLPDAQS